MGIAEPTTKLLTADEYAELGGDEPTELVRGEVIELSRPGFQHGKVCMQAGTLLNVHVRHRDLGTAVGNDTGFVLFTDPDTVRGPDVAFVKKGREPEPGTDEERRHYRGPPDIAIEVLSPDDRAGDIEDKVNEFLDAGCPMVVILNPRRKNATVHRPGDRPLILREADMFDAGDVVPGFVVRVGEFFV